MDVVPLIAQRVSTAIGIGDSKSNSWIFTDPRKQTQYTIDTNKKCDNEFVPLVKLFKWWRREFPIATSKNHPKGIAIEKMVGDTYDSGTHIGETFVLTIEKMVSKYQWNYDNNFVPTVTDPGDGFSNLLDSLSLEEFKLFFEHLTKTAEIARTAYDSTDKEASIKNWRAIFGPEFPDSKRISSTNDDSSAFNYPNRPLNPNKPAGFG